MQVEALYAIISFLGLCVMTLGGLWVRSQDKHREWATERINAHEGLIKVLEETNRNIEKSMSRIETMLDKHLQRVEEQFQRAASLVVKE